MKLSRYFLFAAAVSAALLTAAGCAGYSQQTNLPSHIKTVYVEKISNQINLAAEISTDKAFQIYRPGLEIDLRNALIERFVFDGHLKIAQNAGVADSVVIGQLIRFDRDPTRYNSDDSIQEFRIHVVADLKLVDQVDDKVIWQGNGISGESSYFLSGENASSEDEAVQDALEDLVRHTVEEILEVW